MRYEKPDVFKNQRNVFEKPSQYVTKQSLLRKSELIRADPRKSRSLWSPETLINLRKYQHFQKSERDRSQKSKKRIWKTFIKPYKTKPFEKIRVDPSWSEKIQNPLIARNLDKPKEISTFPETEAGSLRKVTETHSRTLHKTLQNKDFWENPRWSELIRENPEPSDRQKPW